MRAVYCKPGEQDNWDGMLGESSRSNQRQILKRNGTGSQSVIADHSVIVGIFALRHSYKRLTQVPPLILADSRLEEFIQRWLAAREPASVMPSCDRIDDPSPHNAWPSETVLICEASAARLPSPMQPLVLQVLLAT